MRTAQLLLIPTFSFIIVGMEGWPGRALLANYGSHKGRPSD
jgi:hypothetical protein